MCFSASFLFHVNYSFFTTTFYLFDLIFNIKQIIVLDFQWMDTSLFLLKYVIQQESLYLFLFQLYIDRFNMILVSFQSSVIVIMLICDMLFDLLGFVFTLDYLSHYVSLIPNSLDKKTFLPKRGTEYITLTLFLCSIRYTPYFFDKNMLDNILEEAVDQHFHTLIQTRHMQRRRDVVDDNLAAEVIEEMGDSLGEPPEV